MLGGISNAMPRTSGRGGEGEKKQWRFALRLTSSISHCISRYRRRRWDVHQVADAVVACGSGRQANVAVKAATWSTYGVGRGVPPPPKEEPRGSESELEYVRALSFVTVRSYWHHARCRQQALAAQCLMVMIFSSLGHLDHS